MLDAIACNANFENDELLFADETASTETRLSTWPVLIVDDDAEVRQITKLVLGDFTFEGKALQFLEAASGEEARQIVRDRRDLAVILIDVVMESDRAGLETIDYIRNDLENEAVRIILRTGEAGQIPESEVIVRYEIDDYKTKTELTAGKLMATMLTALRSYSLLSKFSETSQQLQTEIERRSRSEEREKAKSNQLAKTLQELRETQAQLVQNERMTGLGQMVAGIAHEVNNPVNFIYGNLIHAHKYVEDLFELIEMYQQVVGDRDSNVNEFKQAIDFPFIVEDIPKMFESMQAGADRIRDIVRSLRNFSRLDEAEQKTVDVREGIENTLTLLQHRLHVDNGNIPIEVSAYYGDLPHLTCYAGQLNQVFFHLFNNAIDALETRYKTTGNRAEPPQIWIRTQLVREDWIGISIRDNGIGICPAQIEKIFDPFFTTKPVGKGTGLGLSICHSIVVGKHSGKIECTSTRGEGTEFTIELPVVQ